MKIESEGYKAYDFKFSLQEKEIVKLLMGEKLYKRKEESIRELLKNSVDGCRLREKLLERYGLKYDPEIVFELTSDKDRIIVTDNGVGMDEDIIERYFTKNFIFLYFNTLCHKILARLFLSVLSRCCSMASSLHCF